MEKKTTNEALTATIINLEKVALEAWNKGNPDTYLNLYTKDFTYFDPYLPKRLDGFDAVEKLYNELRGKVAVDPYEMIDPVVQIAGDVAVLTFNLNSWEGSNLSKWNCTEVYKLQLNEEWKIIHTHWSYIQPLT